MRTLFFGLLVLGLSVSCGYRLSGLPRPGEAPKTIAVSTFENSSFEPGIELMLGSAVRRQFSRPGVVEEVNQSVSPEYLLSGRVLGVRTASRTLTQKIQAIEFTVTVTIVPVLTRDSDGKTFKFDRLARSASEVYLASFDLEVSRKNREEALRQITAVLASRIYDEVVFLTAEAES